MNKYRTLLMFFLGFTIGGIFNGIVFGWELAIKITLFLYFLIIVVIGIEIYLESREDV